MKIEIDHLLSANGVDEMLQRAWYHSSSPHNTKPIDQLKLSDWDILAEDIKIKFAAEEYKDYSINTYSGEAYMKLAGKPLSKKSRSFYVLVLYILIMENQLDQEDKAHLTNFQKARNHFLQKFYHKTAGSSVQKPNVSNGEASILDKTNEFFQKYWWILLLVLMVYIALNNTAGSASEDQTQLAPIETNDPSIKLVMTNEKFGFHPPCNVKFDYDLSNIKYKKAFLIIFDQPITISSPKGSHTQTITAPGVFRIAIQVDDKIKYWDLVIRSNGWYALVDNINLPLKYKNGAMHFDLNQIPAQLLDDGQLYVNYVKIDDWAIDGNEMSFQARIKNPQEEGGISCYDVAFDLVGFKNNKRLGSISFNLLTLNCERYCKLAIGNTILSGQEGYNLINSTLDLSTYRIVKFITAQHCLQIFIDDQKIHDLNYDGAIGDIKYLQIGFMGSGSIDWVRMQSNQTDYAYSEDF